MAAGTTGRRQPLIAAESSAAFQRARIFRFAPLLAAVIFGAWAAYVNREYGIFILVRSGLGQGAYALCSTWIVGRVATDVFAFAGHTTQGRVWSFVSSFLAMVSIPLTIHNLIGTPEITYAILPGIIWGSGYILVYVWALPKKTAQATENNGNPLF